MAEDFKPIHEFNQQAKKEKKLIKLQVLQRVEEIRTYGIN